MTQGLNYIKQNGGSISPDDEIFWLLLDGDIGAFAEYKFGVVLTCNLQYFEKNKKAIIADISIFEDFDRGYKKIVREYAFNLAKRQKKVDSYGENTSAATLNVEVVNVTENSPAVLKSDAKEMPPAKDDEGITDWDEGDTTDIDAHNRFADMDFLTALEKQAIFNKVINKVDFPMHHFTEAGIRFIAHRALIKVKLYDKETTRMNRKF